MKILSPHKWWVVQSLVFFVVSMKKLLNAQIICQWFEMPWHSCDITVMHWEWINDNFALGHQYNIMSSARVAILPTDINHYKISRFTALPVILQSLSLSSWVAQFVDTEQIANNPFKCPGKHLNLLSRCRKELNRVDSAIMAIFLIAKWSLVLTNGHQGNAHSFGQLVDVQLIP